jgi:hypothetical protein
MNNRLSVDHQSDVIMDSQIDRLSRKIILNPIKMSRRQDCPVDENGNFLDAITADIVPPDRLIAIPAGQTVNCFDIDTLYRWVRDHPDARNPITQIPLDQETLRQIHQYGESMRRQLIVNLRGVISFRFVVEVDWSLGEVILNIFRRRQQGFEDIRGSLMNYNFLVQPLSSNQPRSVYDYNLLTQLRDTDIRDAKQPSNTGIVFEAIVLSGDPNNIREKMYRRWYQYAQGKRVDWILDLIPPQYQQIPREEAAPEIEAPSPVQFRQMSQIIFTHSGSGQDLVRRLGQYIYQQNPKISAEQARTLINLFPVRLDRHNGLLLQHLIYSRVVDKWNLRQYSGVQGYYYQRQNQPPTYRVVPGLERNDIENLLSIENIE